MNNYVIMGYFLKAALDLEINKKDIDNILTDMYYVFDELTYYEAETYYKYNIHKVKYDT